MIPHQNDAAMQAHITKWRSSNLTQAAYCKRHGIKPHVFGYYKKKFGLAADPKSRTVALIPVNLVSADDINVPKISPAVSVIKINHANGFSLEFYPGTGLDYLKPLLELVSAI
jgi:hypothetical protein